MPPFSRINTSPPILASHSTTPVIRGIRLDDLFCDFSARYTRRVAADRGIEQCLGLKALDILQQSEVECFDLDSGSAHSHTLFIHVQE
jgi:hypothetical protein